MELTARHEVSFVPSPKCVDFDLGRRDNQPSGCNDLPSRHESAQARDGDEEPSNGGVSRDSNDDSPAVKTIAVTKSRSHLRREERKTIGTSAVGSLSGGINADCPDMERHRKH